MRLYIVLLFSNLIFTFTNAQKIRLELNLNFINDKLDTIAFTEKDSIYLSIHDGTLTMKSIFAKNARFVDTLEWANNNEIEINLVNENYKVFVDKEGKIELGQKPSDESFKTFSRTLYLCNKDCELALAKRMIEIKNNEIKAINTNNISLTEEKNNLKTQTGQLEKDKKQQKEVIQKTEKELNTRNKYLNSTTEFLKSNIKTFAFINKNENEDENDVKIDSFEILLNAFKVYENMQNYNDTVLLAYAKRELMKAFYTIFETNGRTKQTISKELKDKLGSNIKINVNTVFDDKAYLDGNFVASYAIFHRFEFAKIENDSITLLNIKGLDTITGIQGATKLYLKDYRGYNLFVDNSLFEGLPKERIIRTGMLHDSLLFLAYSDKSAQLFKKHSEKEWFNIAKFPHKKDKSAHLGIISRNGRMLLTSSLDGTAKLWDTNGNLLATYFHTINSDKNGVAFAFFSNDDKYILTATHTSPITKTDCKIWLTPEAIFEFCQKLFNTN